MVPADLTNIPTSNEITRPGRTPLHSSSRNDYFHALVERGIVSDKDDFVSNFELVAEIQRHWQRKSGQIGCRFAQFMAHDPPEHNWHRIVIGASEPKAWTEADVGAHVEKAIEDPTIAALSLIFPEVETHEEIALLVRYFGNLSPRQIKELPADEQEDLIRLGIRIQINESVRAYALAFGPFSELFPLTRRAPFLEIAFPAGPKQPPLREGLTDDPDAAHLADVPVNLSDKAWNNMMSQTKRLKADILKPSHPGARARVTISLPYKIWK
jgi:hypothetical protein